MRAASRCEYCRAPEQVFNFAFQVEHISPRSLGGSDATSNLALACESCNLYKADAVTASDELTGLQSVLFDPRRDLWADHFLFIAQNGTITGTTSVGRATVLRLRFNSDFQIRARRHWLRLGLYP